MRWLLDDGPFGQLAREFQPKWDWPAATLGVVDVVAQAAAKDKSGRRAKLLGMTTPNGGAVSVLGLLADSAAADLLFDYFRPNASFATKDWGEHASIAYCVADDRDAIFVTCDRGAAYLALAELGPGRVASPFDLWHWLASEGLVSVDTLNALCQFTIKNAGDLPGVPSRFSR
ncbi:MAG TPA: hypothetical protein VGM29_17045 [Polyangiaceae bacterium]|jgi:hypothetical protein